MKQPFFTFLLFIATYVVLVSDAQSQAFVDVYPFPQIGDGCRVILKDGTENKGKWKYWNGTMKNTMNFAIKSEEGESIKYNPADVARIYITLSAMAKYTMSVPDNNWTAEESRVNQSYVVGSKNGKDVVMTDQEVELTTGALLTIFDLIKNWKKNSENENELIFEFVEEKGGKYAMREMINPGFEQKYKAFMFGYNFNEIMLIDKNNKQVMVRKKEFVSDFPVAFGDCAEFMALYPDLNAINYDKLAYYLFTYNQICAE